MLCLWWLHFIASGLHMLFACKVFLGAVHNQEQLFWQYQASGKHGEQEVWLWVVHGRLGLGLGLQYAVRDGCQPRKAKMQLLAPAQLSVLMTVV